MANLTRGKNFEKMKSHILHIVAKRFLKSGYHATTLREVAKEAGVSYSSLINIFGTKEGLLTELVGLVLEYQFERASALVAGKCEDKIFLYATEAVMQLYMAESSEHMREMYAISYSLSESSRVIYKTVTEKLEGIFKRQLPELSTSDFYELELAAAGIMRNYMLTPCDMYFTMEAKVRAFLRMTLRLYLVTEEKIDEVTAFVLGIDFGKIAAETLDGLFEYLKKRT